MLMLRRLRTPAPKLAMTCTAAQQLARQIAAKWPNLTALEHGNV